jgi:hypothetical protein
VIRETRGVFAAWAVFALTVLFFAAPAGGAVRSNPPRTSFLVNTSSGTIGVTPKLGVPASAFMQKWGLPDYGGSLEPGKVEMLWSRTTRANDAWAVVRLAGASSTKVTEARFGGSFRTLQGDRRGTGLAAFLKHWPHHGAVTAVSRAGVQVEWNVVVGGVVFAFDMTKRLQAIGLAAKADAQRLCAIPAACVTSSLK